MSNFAVCQRPDLWVAQDRGTVGTAGSGVTADAGRFGAARAPGIGANAAMGSASRGGLSPGIPKPAASTPALMAAVKNTVLVADNTVRSLPYEVRTRHE
ncbi:MAG: hypothetical protein QOH27_352 [Mycobacterium sp.]|jgi:hypothetical protein|nr:hypothetical protein [Mycobacterium sp.]